MIRRTEEKTRAEIPPKTLKDAIAQIRADLQELESWFPVWESQSVNYEGSRKIRGIANRVVQSSQRVKELVKENTFSR